MPGYKQRGLCSALLRFPPSRATRQHVDEASSNSGLPVRWWWGSGYHSDLISTTHSHYRRVTFENRAISAAKRYWRTGNRPINARWTRTSRHAPWSRLSSHGFKWSHSVRTCSCSFSISHRMCCCETSTVCWLQSKAVFDCKHTGSGWYCDSLVISCSYIAVPRSRLTALAGY